VKTFADAEAVLATALPGYESRPPQQALAQAVEALFANPDNFILRPEDPTGGGTLPPPKHLFAQAGTGTGKSLGYAIPALLSRKRVIISVTTKALQDQLAGKDFPFLEANLGVTFSWCLLKGRSNYFCTNKAEGAEEADVPRLAEALRVAMEGGEDFDGTRESFVLKGLEFEHGAWAKICAESEECSANNCKTSGGCYAERARDIARSSDVVIVNHALFFTDLMVKQYGFGGMLDEYDVVIFDEAHEVEEIAANTLGSQFTEGTIRALTAQARNFARRYGDDGDEPFTGLIGALLGDTQVLFEALEPGRLRAVHVNDNADQFGRVFDHLERLRTTLLDTGLDHTPDYPKAKKTKDRLVRMATSARDRFVSIITADWDGTVRWIEAETNKNGETRKVLKTAPVDVAPILREQLFRRTPAVLCSATLAVGGDFAYMAGRLGVDTYDHLDVGTPFDYPKQARLYIPTHLPEPKGGNTAAWEAQATEEMIDLIKAAEGRSLVLFTSTKHMRAAYDAVSRRVPYPVRMQGEQGSTTKALAEWFHATTEGVLFGTKSFFTGVDFQGETCTAVIIAKMPFPVPSEPMTEARCEAIERAGGDSFKDYTIPVMSLVLQQAIGRLIRHRDDNGIAAILDPRILSKGYGKRILRDLPPMPLVKSMDEVTGYLDGLKEVVPA
jgi:ATP-dependent DNA helicase DinG